MRDAGGAITFLNQDTARARTANNFLCCSESVLRLNNNQANVVSLLADLNPCDFYLLGVLEYKVYSNNSSTENDLKKRTHNIVPSIYQFEFQSVTDTCLLV
jgi:hypothetical protein